MHCLALEELCTSVLDYWETQEVKVYELLAQVREQVVPQAEDTQDRAFSGEEAAYPFY